MGFDPISVFFPTLVLFFLNQVFLELCLKNEFFLWFFSYGFVFNFFLEIGGVFDGVTIDRRGVA